MPDLGNSVASDDTAVNIEIPRSISTNPDPAALTAPRGTVLDFCGMPLAQVYRAVPDPYGRQEYMSEHMRLSLQLAQNGHNLIIFGSSPTPSKFLFHRSPSSESANQHQQLRHPCGTVYLTTPPPPVGHLRRLHRGPVLQSRLSWIAPRLTNSQTPPHPLPSRAALVPLTGATAKVKPTSEPLPSSSASSTASPRSRNNTLQRLIRHHP